MDPLLDFQNKVVLITGAASGFGKLLAEGLAQRKAKLVLGDFNAEGVQQVAQQLKNSGADVVAKTCDVGIEQDCEALVTTAIDTFGCLDIAVNNAGIANPMNAFTELTEQDLDNNFRVNTKGVFLGMKHQIPAMLKNGSGSILNVSSMAGIGGAPKIAAYSASKHAVVGLTKTAAAEYAKKGLRVNAICPFYSPTPLIPDDPDIQNFLGQASPMKRLGDPEEIVAVMILLLSPGNTYMTGQAIAVDGGVSAL